MEIYNINKMMNNTLIVSVVQTSLFWEDVDANLSSLKHKILQQKEKTDIVILPEMFASGFSMNGKEKISQRYTDIIGWMKEMSQSLNSCILGSTVYGCKDRYYNRFLFIKPDGDITFYDKRHLFTMGGESVHFKAGTDIVTIDYKGWKIRPFICYDLRFPIWSRNTNNYDIAIYIANWPSERREAWLSLLKARAIENQAYVIGVNCVGKDGMGLKYSGDSKVFDAKGGVICECTPFEEEIKLIELNYSELQYFRERFPVLNDADNFII